MSDQEKSKSLLERMIADLGIRENLEKIRKQIMEKEEGEEGEDSDCNLGY